MSIVAEGHSRRLRVLLISHTCQSRTEGQPKAQWLGQADGIELCVLSPDRWKHYGHWRGVDIPASPRFRFLPGKVALPWVGPAQFYLHFYPNLAKILKAFQPDIIDLWEEPWGLVSAHACSLRNRLLPGCKIISETEQNIDKHLPFPFEYFRGYTLRNASFAIGRNAESVRILRTRGYRGPAEVVPNAVDAELFKPIDKSGCQGALGLSGFVVGYAGRFVEEKGLADLVQAISLCEPSVKLVLIGSGPYEAELRRRVAALRLESRVRFLPGVPLEELPAVMNAMNVFVLPSRTTPRWKEQFGRVIIEAHACGVPVIGSDSGAIPDVIGEAGIVFPEGNAAALAVGISSLAANPEQATRLGDRGRVQVEEFYTWERVAQRMAGIYHSVSQIMP